MMIHDDTWYVMLVHTHTYWAFTPLLIRIYLLMHDMISCICLTLPHIVSFYGSVSQGDRDQLHVRWDTARMTQNVTFPRTRVQTATYGKLQPGMLLQHQLFALSQRAGIRPTPSNIPHTYANGVKQGMTSTCEPIHVCTHTYWAFTLSLFHSFIHPSIH